MDKRGVRLSSSVAILLFLSFLVVDVLGYFPSADGNVMFMDEACSLRPYVSVAGFAVSSSLLNLAEYECGHGVMNEAGYSVITFMAKLVLAIGTACLLSVSLFLLGNPVKEAKRERLRELQKEGGWLKRLKKTGGEIGLLLLIALFFYSDTVIQSSALYAKRHTNSFRQDLAIILVYACLNIAITEGYLIIHSLLRLAKGEKQDA